MSQASTLPDDVPSLKRLLAARDEMIAKLVIEIARLKRWQYGRSAERMDEAVAQLQLALDDLRDGESVVVPPPEALPPSEPLPAAEKNNKVVSFRRKARAFPAHLPRETIVHPPAHCNCPACGGKLRQLGEDISELLDFIPGFFKVIRHIRPKLSCAACSTIVQAPAPSRPIERGMAAPGLLAQIVVGKYADHCPLYRQEGIYRRSGVELDRATMAVWVGEAADLVRPLVDAVGRYVRSAEKIHADDTPVPVLDPGRGSTKTARIWTYVRDDRPAGSQAPPAVWYQYTPDRKSERPQRHLRGYRGILQADAYSGFIPLYADGTVVEAGCWAHARRKFYDVWKVDRSPIAAEAIRRIGLIYDIERAVRGKLPEQRQAVRQEYAAPILAALFDWLGGMLTQIPGKSSLAGAIKYALVRWEAMTRYSIDGRIEIDNNTAERSIRPLVLGRKNHLFKGSDRGGESAASIYTLIGTALLNDVEPYLYLRTVFEQIAEHPVNRIDELLPWRLSLAPSTSQSLAA